jgi:predicted nucleic acid-binding protein
MPEYIADTNVYIMAANDAEFRQRFASFIRDHGPLLVSAIVLGEYLIGIADVAKHQAVVTAMRAGTELVAPIAEDWLTAGSVISRLGGGSATKGRSFWNDALLAAQCSRLRATLITWNEKDFRRLAAHTRVRAISPFPR